MAAIYIHAEHEGKQVEPQVTFRTLHAGSADEFSYVDLTIKVRNSDGRFTDEVTLFVSTPEELLLLGERLVTAATAEMAVAK